MEALCGRMSWTLWKGRSSQTEEKKKQEKKTGEGGGVRKLARRGKEGMRRGRLTKQHPHKPWGPLLASSSTVSLAEAVAELLGWCPGSNVAANRSPEETDICVFSQGMWSYHSPVYKDWAVPPGLLSCPRLSVSLTKRFTPLRFFQWACFTYTLTAYFSHCVWVSGYVRHALRCALAGMKTDLWRTYKQRWKSCHLCPEKLSW